MQDTTTLARTALRRLTIATAGLLILFLLVADFTLCIRRSLVLRGAATSAAYAGLHELRRSGRADDGIATARRVALDEIAGKTTVTVAVEIAPDGRSVAVTIRDHSFACLSRIVGLAGAKEVREEAAIRERQPSAGTRNLPCIIPFIRAC
jgi:hypothetical protein